MSVTDIIIIYLAGGSPFAVQFLLRENKRTALQSVTGVILRLLFWPVSVSAMLYRLFTGITTNAAFYGLRSVESDLARIQAELETVAFDRPQITSIFAFRGIFLRYTGLALESSSPSHVSTTAEIFEISHHPKPALGSVCLARKNRARLWAHHEQARNDFIELILELANDNERRDEIAMLATNVAGLVEDIDCIHRLRLVFAINVSQENTVLDTTEVGKLWSTRSQRHSTAN